MDKQQYDDIVRTAQNIRLEVPLHEKSIINAIQRALIFGLTVNDDNVKKQFEDNIHDKIIYISHQWQKEPKKYTNLDNEEVYKLLKKTLKQAVSKG